MEYTMPRTQSMPPYTTEFPDLTQQGETQIGPGGTVSTNSYQEMFARLIGRYVICDFLIGTNTLYTRDGILTAVGQSYFLLYDPRTQATTSCDLYSLKFTTSFPQGVDVAQLMDMAPEQRNAYAQQLMNRHDGRMRILADTGMPGAPLQQVTPNQTGWQQPTWQQSSAGWQQPSRQQQSARGIAWEQAGRNGQYSMPASAQVNKANITEDSLPVMVILD